MKDLIIKIDLETVRYVFEFILGIIGGGIITDWLFKLK